MPLWLVRLAGVAICSCLIAGLLSWSVSRGHLFDLLTPWLEKNPRYSVATALMKQRHTMKVDVLILGSPAFAQKTAAAFSSCVTTLPLGLPGYRYDMLFAAIKAAKEYDYRHVYVENHPALWSHVLLPGHVPQADGGWRRRVGGGDRAVDIRADLKVAFGLLIDAVRSFRTVNYGVGKKRLQVAYRNRTVNDDLRAWDRTGVVRRLIGRVKQKRFNWFMGFNKGPYIETDPDLHNALKKRFTGGELDPDLGNLYALKQLPVEARKLSRRLCRVNGKSAEKASN